MLKLKNLFDNRDLAEMIVKRWDYDEITLNDTFKYYRISSNAIYPFKSSGEVRYLRFAPVEEKNRDNIISELSFINYLKINNYPVLVSVKSKNNKELEEIDTPWGRYYATVFERVAGIQLEDVKYTSDICKKYGKALGRLHRLSSEYKAAATKHWTYEEVLTWIEGTILGLENETKALEEVKIVRSYLSKLPKDSLNFGLVHYDFELDNIFYDKATDTLNVIDFDDAMYHWYVMDIFKSLNSILENTDLQDISLMKNTFIKGYKEEFDVSDEMLTYLPIFERFSNLYSYCRVLRSLSESWDNEPDWMSSLRLKLGALNTNLAKSFN